MSLSNLYETKANAQECLLALDEHLSSKLNTDIQLRIFDNEYEIKGVLYTYKFIHKNIDPATKTITESIDFLNLLGTR